MQASATDLPESPSLDSYPHQVTLPSRFGDLGPSGQIEHIGMARYYEDARSVFMQQLCQRHGVDRALWRAFLVRAINEELGPVRYPDPIVFGAGVIAVGGSSYTLEMAAFQDDRCVGRSRSVAAAVGPDHALVPLPERARAILTGDRLSRPAWRAPGKPSRERQQLAHYAHHLTLPTRFSDTDAIGHLNNVSLLKYCEEGRVALLLAAWDGKPLPGWAGRVVHLDISYLQEARLSHPLTIASVVREVDGPAMHLEQAVFQRDACVVVCDCTVEVSL
jgi:acyl-CoA thioester hydrolase